MENEAAQPLFVSDPVFNKEGVTGFTSYTLQGSKLPEPLSRRYRDFDALRRKFIDRWPGVFIPNIPHKKTVGNKDKEIVGLRIEMINRFLKKLSKIDYLFNSDEMELFLQNSSNVPKTLDSIKEDTYEELLKKYASVFTDYDDNFDTITGKKDQDEFAKKLDENYPKLRAFRTFIAQEKERFKDVQKNYLVIINNLSIYEKEVVNTFVNNDENKLVFYNMKNIDLCKNISNAQEKLEKDIENLGQVIKIATFNMQNQIKNFKNVSLEHYYGELSRIEKDTESNAKIFDDLWDTVVKDGNISEYN